MKKPQSSFEENYEVIRTEVQKHRGKWTLNSINWMDWNDISSIIIIHIHKKWNQYNQSKPLKPWLSTLITNQIKNLVRNHYTNYARPCLRCHAAIDSDGCKIYKTQCDACPLYAHWQTTKQSASFIKLPLSIENHTNEVHEMQDYSEYNPADEPKFHEAMKTTLKPIEFTVYSGLYIDHKEESADAKEIGFTTNELGRVPGYKNLFLIQKTIIEKAREFLNETGLH